MGTPVSIGICAYNEAGRIRDSLESLASQTLPSAFEIVEILVVASGCTDGTEAQVLRAAQRDVRIELIREPERRGKASALNRILAVYRGDLLVLVNADAQLAPDSLMALLRVFTDFPETSVACGAPVAEANGGLPHLVQEVQWNLHNRVLAVQSAQNRENHCCDELMAIRRGFVDSLPPDLINDGAYFGVLAALSRQTVRFSRDARVIVHTPRSVRGLVAQRRRILQGHRQVRRILHHAPTTLEHLSKQDPPLAARILAGEIREHPFALLVLVLLALPLEALSAGLAAPDEMKGPAYASAWPKVDYL